MMDLLLGKTAVVTGGASGIGREICISMADHGANVIVADVRREPRLDGRPTDELIERESSVEATYVECDVTEIDDLTVAIGAAEQFGGVDIMVNNAGIDRSETFTEVGESSYHEMMNVNAKSAFFGSQIAAERMLEKESGSIVNVSSISGLAGSRNSVSYSASKGAVRLMTYSIASQLGPYGIRANVVHPGIIETAMVKQESSLSDDEQQAEAYRNQIPLRSFGDPVDIANAAVFLASDMSKYVTGESLVVDGGWWHSR